MNIFHLHKVPKVCAEYHCDKHVVKMILETAQMLSTAYQRHCGLDDELYKPAYPKHPMTIWVGDSVENFTYAWYLGTHLGLQYTKRYRKLDSILRPNKIKIKKRKSKTNSMIFTAGKETIASMRLKKN